MVGGAAADLERVRPVFGAMGKTITLCGPAGAGHALKALNNYLSAAGLVAMCEALVVGRGIRPRSRHHGRCLQHLDRQEQRHRGEGPPVRRAAQLLRRLLDGADGQGPAHRGRGRESPRAQHAQPAAGGRLLDTTPTASSERAPTTPRSSATPRGSPKRDHDHALRTASTSAVGQEPLTRTGRAIYKPHLGPLAPPPGGDRRGPHRTTQHSFQLGLPVVRARASFPTY